jgi:hypothetical protein
MKRSAIAFLLSCLTVAALCNGYYDLLQPAHLSNQVLVYGEDSVDDAVSDQKVKVIQELHLQNVHVLKVVVPTANMVHFFWGLLSMTVVCAVVTGLVIFFYKLYCRWMGTTPHL